jgi:sugar lactone lactonase YvrE
MSIHPRILTLLALGLLVPAANAHAATTVVVSDSNNNAITAYPLGSSTPSRTIAGASTGLRTPLNLAADRAGNLYATNLNTPSVTVYAPGASGNAAPTRTITGAATGLRTPFGIAVDGTGRIYVGNANPNLPSILEYGPTANGNTAPVAAIAGPATGLYMPLGIARDQAGHLFVLNGNSTVTEYAAAASGNVAPIATLRTNGSGLTAANRIAIDSAGNLFLSGARFVTGPSADYTVEEFAAGATGDAKPVAILDGPDTGLLGPAGVAILPGVPQLLVANTNGNTLTQYAVPANGDARPVATTKATAATGLVVLAAPAITPPGTLHATAGKAFAQTLAAGGGFGPYTWSLASGALPAGLSLNAATGAISGTPASAGTTTFTVKATDQSLPTPQAATTTVTLAVDPAIQPAVYVANGGNGTLTSYAVGGSGNLAPLTTFGRLGFGLNAPAAVTIAPSGRVYVANGGGNTVTSYAPGAAAMPLSTISGTDTGLQGPAAITTAAGFLYVANQPANTVTVYGAGAGGDAPPVRTISGPDTGLNSPDGVTVDAAGRLWVANAAANSLTAYAPGATGDAKPVATIVGSATGLNTPRALAQDEAGDLLVTNLFGHSVTTYATSANGNAFPKATLSGSDTTIAYPTGVDIDTQGRLFVANQYDDDVHVFAAGATGDAKPVATIAGPATGLSGPGALAVTPPLSVVTEKLPAATAGHRYTAQLRAAEGTTPYRWSLVRGARLPRGLRLTGHGVIAGVARRAGTTRLAVRVTDDERRAARATQRLTLVVRG